MRSRCCIVEANNRNIARSSSLRQLSFLFSVSCGVHQGEVLFPILFSIDCT